MSVLILQVIIRASHCCHSLHFFFFFSDTATTEIYTLSLHDALPISRHREVEPDAGRIPPQGRERVREVLDRKSTRLNSSHLVISYAVFCLKKNRMTTTTCGWRL